MADRTEEQLEEVEALEQIFEDDEGALEVVRRETPIVVRITVRAASAVTSAACCTAASAWPLCFVHAR